KTVTVENPTYDGAVRLPSTKNRLRVAEDGTRYWESEYTSLSKEGATPAEIAVLEGDDGREISSMTLGKAIGGQDRKITLTRRYRSGDVRNLLETISDGVTLNEELKYAEYWSPLD